MNCCDGTGWVHFIDDFQTRDRQKKLERIPHVQRCFSYIQYFAIPIMRKQPHKVMVDVSGCPAAIAFHEQLIIRGERKAKGRAGKENL